MTNIEIETYKRKPPKTSNEIHMIGDIADDLRYLTIGFPEPAVKAALERQAAITPILFDFLKDAIQSYNTPDKNYYGHIYALFLLAAFREKQAFPLMIELMSLPNEGLIV